MSGVIDAGLGMLLEALAADGARSAPSPRFDRDARESPADWLARVRRARAAADAHALRHREALDRIGARRFAATVGDLVPAARVPLSREVAVVEVPAGAQLDDLVPALSGTAPRGPAPRVPDGPVLRVEVAVTAPPRPRGAVVRLHGGAFWMGGGEVAGRIDRALVDTLAGATGLAVFDVDYRLAPEHPYPAAIVDALLVLDAIRHGRIGPRVDPARIALVGTSSGANTVALAAAADALRARPAPLAGLGLVVPSMLLARTRPDLPTQARLAREEQLRGYLGTDVPADHPWVSPGVRTTIAGMPPVFAAVAEYDDVAFGGEELCAAVVAGGGTAEVRRYPMTHTSATPAVEAAVIRDLAGFLATRIGD
ncbi:alpha/beta hydrolase fold domain-containing protein [Microbacterium sp. GXF7504]